MPRPPSFFECQSCGAKTQQYFGRCASCGDWNSITEQVNLSSVRQSRNTSSNSPKINLSEPISKLSTNPINRFSSGYSELDRVLGGGIVPGSLVLVGGDPGIGKSTLLLQSATSIANTQSVLYVSAEESAQQVKLRWKRLAKRECSLRLLAETNLELVLQELESLKPAVAIIDSIQALHDDNITSAAGSVAQVRDCSAALHRLAKKQNTALLLVGHVTKEGMLAGPKVLEHLVDVVLTFEGDRFASHRLLRAVKNRYGATHELGVFEMQGEGLAEVSNPSELFISPESAAGVATIVACEATRALVIDIQALVSATSYASPRRTATGVEVNRLHQILAVLEKHMGLALSRHDCYLAVAGGLEVEEPAADLGIAAAIVSSFRDLKLPERTVLIGELGLGGQLRAVGQMSQRIEESIRLGFTRAVVPKGSEINLANKQFKLEILEATYVQEALLLALEKGSV